MKARNAAIILDESLTTLLCRFSPSSGAYTFLCTKELAKRLEEKDLVVGSKSDGQVVLLHVVEVHEESEVDLDFTYDYSFVFQKVDQKELKELNNILEGREKELRKLQRGALRKQVLAQIEQGKLTSNNTIEVQEDEEE